MLFEIWYNYIKGTERMVFYMVGSIVRFIGSETWYWFCNVVHRLFRSFGRFGFIIYRLGFVLSIVFWYLMWLMEDGVFMTVSDVFAGLLY